MIAFLFDFSKVINVHTYVAEDISSSLLELYNLGIVFLPIEVIKSNKTTGWLGAAYNKLIKVQCYI